MDWPISWQKIKDNGGYEILDLEDYGIRIDGSSDNIVVEGTQLLDDMTKVVKSGKTIAVKVKLSGLTGKNADLLVPAISYTVDEGGNVNEVIGLTRIEVPVLGELPIRVKIHRNSDANTTVWRLFFVWEIPTPPGTMATKYVLTSWDDGVLWELGDCLLDLSGVAVAVGNTTSIDSTGANILDAYSGARKNLTAKFRFIDPADSENEVTSVVGLNLMIINHATNGTTTMAYVGTAAGMFFRVYKEESHWVYSVTQLSQSETTNPSV